MNAITCALIVTLPAAVLVGCGKREEPPTPPAPAPAATIPAPAETAPPAAPATGAAKTLTETAKQAVQTATGKYASLLNAFQGADANTLATVQKAVTAMEGGQWANALTLLQQLLSGNLTAPQKQAVQDVVAAAQKESGTAAVGQVTTDAQKSLEDAQKTLPFGK